MALTAQHGSVANVPPPLEDYNLFLSNRPLVEALERWGTPEAVAEASVFGELLGRAETLRLGDLANDHPPVLREDGEVEFHPAWHELLRIGREAGLTGLGWDETPAGHVARAAMFMTLSQVEAGVGCPLSMTHAAVPALRTTPALAAEWEPRLVSRSADGAWCGMSMTERQGGSDVRANLMRAEPAGERRRRRSTARSGSARRLSRTHSMSVIAMWVSMELPDGQSYGLLKVRLLDALQ